MNKSSPCRLCLSEYNVNVPIFRRHNKSNNNDVLAKILRFTPIKISEDDSLPQYICNSCLKLLELFHQFSLTTANSEIKLLQAISSNSNPTTTITMKNRRGDDETPPIGRVFSFAETLRSLDVKEEEPESIYSLPTVEATTAIHRIQLYTTPSQNDSYENIFSTFRHYFSVEAINAINHHNYITQKNSPNVLLPQLQSTESKNAIELNCGDIEQRQERREAQDNQDGVPEGDRVNIIDIQTSDYTFEMEHSSSCGTFGEIDGCLDSYGESQSIQSLNSEIFHADLGYIHDLDKDVQVTLVDEHLLPMSLVTKKHAPLRWLLDHYCKFSGNAPNQIGFQHNGRLIKDSSTVCELGLRHGDMLQVVLLWQQPRVLVSQRIRYYKP